MQHLAFRRLIVGVIVGGSIAACAQIEGLGNFENVDCVDDCPDAAGDVAITPPPPTSIDSGNDAATCPPCSGSTPICDPVSLKCVECLPGKLECASGYFCDPDPMLGFHCVLGCGVVSDCIKVLSMDAGPDVDAAGDGGDGGIFSTYACCNNRCIDTASSSANCGMCGNACGIGSACCASTCTDITSNAASCGGCGNVCSNNNIATPTCTLGKCSGMCNQGFDDCDNDKLTNGCESDIYNDPNKCGACNHTCSNNHVLATHCSVGTCDGDCDSANGWADCNNNKLVDGCEVNITNNADHCGACPNVCSNNNMATRACDTSTCDGTCNGGYADCNANKLADGCEVNTTNDANNCGGCNFVCSNNNMATRTCAGSACNGTCSAGFADCDSNKLSNGCETNTNTDPNHCGACLNKVCSSYHIAAPTCAAGTCNGTCDTGWSDCDNNKLTDGCESKTDQDAQHCGASCPGTTCNAATGKNCVAGTCTTGYDYGMTFAPVGFIDACAQAGATRLTLASVPAFNNLDDGTVPTSSAGPLLPIGFTFTYFGVARTGFWISTNGFVGFDLTNVSAACCQWTCLPDASKPTNTIQAFADDLIVDSTSGVCYATVGAAGARKLVVTYTHTHKFQNNAADLTFSLILEETTNKIDVVYSSMSGMSGGEVVGVEGTTATTFTCGGTPNTPIASGASVTFLP